MANPTQSAFQAQSIYQTPMVDDQTHQLTWPWARQFQQAAAQLNAPVSALPPATSGDGGMPGQIAFDADYAYFAVGTNLWKRIPLTSF